MARPRKSHSRSTPPNSSPKEQAHHSFLWTSFVQAFAGETPRDLEILQTLTQNEFLSDANPQSAGLSDFLAAGQLKNAQFLSKWGLAPLPVRYDHRFGIRGTSAVCSATRAFALLIHDNHPTEQTVQSQTQTAIYFLRWLAKLGAPFSGVGPAQDPFIAAAEARHSSARAMGMAILDELKALGADPNQSGQWLSTELSMMPWHSLGPGAQSSPVFFEKALALGANPALCPGRTLAAPGSWFCAEDIKASPGWFTKLQALGADPKNIPNPCPLEEHPVALAMERKNFVYAWSALENSTAPDWVSSKDGKTLFHLLAPQSSKDSIKSTEKLLARPEARALINAQESAGSDRPGQTALMIACAALNEKQAALFLEAGANPNLLDAKGHSALRHAGRKFGLKAQLKTAGIVKLLLRHGADPSLAALDGKTPAQAMAAKAPLGALTELLALRPDDLLGQGNQSKEASRLLRKRGAQAISVVEDVLLSQDIASIEAPSGKKNPRL